MTRPGDLLAAAQARAADLGARVTGMWAQVEQGQDVDPDELSSAEAHLAVAERALPRLHTLAVAAAEADALEVWAEVEAGALAEHEARTVAFLEALDVARGAQAAVLDAASRLNHYVAQFVEDPRRPASVVSGPTWSIQREQAARAGGQRLITAPAGDVVLALAADGLDRLARSGAPAWGTFRHECARVRTNMVLPVDPRPTTEGPA